MPWNRFCNPCFQRAPLCWNLSWEYYWVGKAISTLEGYQKTFWDLSWEHYWVGKAISTLEGQKPPAFSSSVHFHPKHHQTDLLKRTRGAKLLLYYNEANSCNGSIKQRSKTTGKGAPNSPVVQKSKFFQSYTQR